MTCVTVRSRCAGASKLRTFSLAELVLLAWVARSGRLLRMIIGIASADFARRSITADGGEHWGGPGWVRLGQWIPLWSQHHEVHAGELWNRGDHLEIEVDLPDGSRQFVAPDVVYLQRKMDDVAAVLRRARASGQLIVQDIDDWFWGLDPRNKAFPLVAPKLADYAAGLAESDVIVASTRYLAERLAERFGGKRIVVIPNYVDVDRFTPTEHAGDPDDPRPVVGWAGATEFRSGDLAELRGVLGQVRGEVRFRHAGHAEDAPRFAAEVGLPDDAVELVGRAGVAEFPTLLDFQVGLVPLRSTPFNEAKSDLKGLEYAAAGIPFVASPTSPYRELHERWGDCVRIARKPVDWVKGIRHFADPAVRQDAAEELRKQVLERHLTEGLHHHLDLFGALDHRSSGGGAA